MLAQPAPAHSGSADILVSNLLSGRGEADDGGALVGDPAAALGGACREPPPVWPADSGSGPTQAERLSSTASAATPLRIEP